MRRETVDQPMRISVGGQAPGFSLIDETGREVNVRWTAAATVLVFYRGDW